MKSSYALLSAAITLAGISSNAAAYNQYTNQQCREYTRTIEVGGRLQEGFGKACLQPDGSWRMVSEAQPQASRQTTHQPAREVVVYRDHHHHYDHRRHYGPKSGIAISFGKGWGHRGHYGYGHKHHKHHRHSWHRRAHGNHHAWHRGHKRWGRGHHHYKGCGHY